VSAVEPSAASLAALCGLARACLGAAAVSLAVVEDTSLYYVAADGAGAEEIVGTRLPAGRGIAGFTAATGQSLTVRDPVTDPRFARDVGEATGYVPASIQCVPVDADGEVVAVLSILDRADSTGGAPVIDWVTAIAAALVPAHVDSGSAVADRVAGLAPGDRARAVEVIDAVLGVFER